MFSIALDAIYAAGIVATSPIWLYRMIRHGRYRDGITEKFGAAPIRNGPQPVIWVHGVSLGEINATRTLVDQLHAQLPDFKIVISSSTDTGIAAARRLFAPDHEVFHWPLDFTWATARAIDRIGPNLVVLMEGEIWPNFLAACNKREIPVAVVNARISADKGYPRYKKLGPLAAKLFNRLDAIGAQDEAYAQRYKSLGVDPSKIHITGMLKFDSAQATGDIEGKRALAQAMDISDQDRLIVAGGTGPDEELILLDIFSRISKDHPSSRLAIVPRKPERFDEVAGLIESAGWALARRSEYPDGCIDKVAPSTVILGDTMGELRKFYSLASCVFVGRSLVPMGGSDMIESAALARPTAFGPHTFNFPQADALADNGCVRVADPDELEITLNHWLADPESATEAGRTAQQYVLSQQGATGRNVEMLCKLLGRTPAEKSGQVATDII